jgi:hypothetical protein
VAKLLYYCQSAIVPIARINGDVVGQWCSGTGKPAKGQYYKTSLPPFLLPDNLHICTCSDR